jgi:hypothetical protein
MGIFDVAVSVLMKIAFRFEFFFPQFIGFYVGRKLKKYKKKGLLEDYAIKSKQRGKYHCLFDMDFILAV